jgi:hypothetical protein
LACFRPIGVANLRDNRNEKIQFATPNSTCRAARTQAVACRIDLTSDIRSDLAGLAGQSDGSVTRFSILGNALTSAWGGPHLQAFRNQHSISATDQSHNIG